MVTIPFESVGFRTGAVPSREAVAVVHESATKRNSKASGDSGGVGLDLETVLSVQAWVHPLPEPRYSWFDLHVFDDGDRLIRSETLPLRYVRAGEDDGDVYGFEGAVYRGTGASPGSVWLAPDARKLQFRVYYEAGGTVYTDGLLRQHELPSDSDLTNSGAPPPPRRRRTPPAAD
ncbi:MAG TPA: hypothetical protein VL337_16920 [Acidimicrobiales bacterium]|jgi:hypothetical protein|nr:hypothetical protein [Acidimicrobiales bacterium]